MTNTLKRQKLMIYLAEAEDKKVNALYSLLEENIGSHSFQMTDKHRMIIQERDAKYQSGKTKPTTWQDAHNRIRNKRKD